MRAAVVVAGVLGLVAPAIADTLPAGRVSLVMGGKTGTGRLANDIGAGPAFGVEAGYAPMDTHQRLGWGVAWSTVWSYYQDGARVSGSLWMVELDLGVRARVALGARRRQVLWLGGGGALLRTNDPILVDGDRHYVGPFGAAGIEGRLWKFVFGMNARYGLITEGQGTLGVLMTIGTGS